MFTQTGEIPIFSAPAPGSRRARRAAAGVFGVALLAAIQLAVWTLRSTASTTVDSGTLNTASRFFVSLDRRPSHNRTYQAEIVETDRLEAGRQQRWIFRLSQRDHRRVPFAKVAVTTWAPETGEVSTRVATSRYIGRGNYRLDGIYFPHPGWWNVALVIDGSGGVDSVAFNVTLPPRDVGKVPQSP